MIPVIPTLTFKYLKVGQMHELVLPIVDGWVPLKPLVTAMGLRWDTQHSLLTKQETTQTVPIPGLRGRPPLCMTAESIPDYLLNIVANRASHPDVIKHFQVHFPPALESFLESFQTTDNDVVPDAETDIWDKQQVADFLDSEPIYVGERTSHEDWLRKDLVAVGIRDYDELNYLMSNSILRVWKPHPDGNKDNWLSRPVQTARYYTGTLQSLARQNYYPLPEFYRRHPEYYEQHTMYALRIDKNSLGSPENELTTELVRQPIAMAPWYTDEFAIKISLRLALINRVEEKELRKRLELGELSLNDIWASQEATAAAADFLYEYGNWDEGWEDEDDTNTEHVAA